MAKPPVKDKPAYSAPADTSVFSDEELKALEAEALAEKAEEDKAAASARFKEEIKEKARRKNLMSAGKDAEGEDLTTITINLAPNSHHILLDGVRYFHGVSYKFTQAQAQTIRDTMHRTWRHEREIGNANVNAEAAYQTY